MDSGLKSISSLFSGANKFLIPRYQRLYAWEEPQLKDFWEDITYHNPEQKYFFGTILLKEAGTEGDFEALEVVDGQQRLTTMTIFFSEVIKRLKFLDKTINLSIKIDKYIQYRGIHKLKISELDNDFFQTYVLNIKEKTPTTFETPSQRRLYDAKIFFRDKLLNATKEEINVFFDILEKSDVLVYSVKNSAEATLIFQTTNDRGKGLTNLDKIKSYLMYRAYLSSDDKAADIINNINARFGDIYRVIERIEPKFRQRKIKEVDEEQICQYHYIYDYEWTNKVQYQYYFPTIKAHLDNLGREGEHERVIAYIEEYTNSLKETFVLFEKILDHESKALNDIIYIGQIALFFPLLIKAYKYDTSKDKREFISLLEALEKFSFRYFFLNTLWRSNITHTFNTFARNFEGNFEEVKTNILSLISYKSSSLINTLKSPSLYGQFSSRTLTYLFWKYENHLRTEFQPKSNEMSFSEFTDDSGTYKISIDHITSQTPLNKLMFPRKTEKFNENHLHTIGNLTISPQTSNSSMNNSVWAIKNKYYFEKAPFKTQLELNDFVDDKVKRWNEETINERAKKIIEFALDKWGVATDRI
jgi:hypothetical protein